MPVKILLRLAILKKKSVSTKYSMLIPELKMLTEPNRETGSK